MTISNPAQNTRKVQPVSLMKALSSIKGFKDEMEGREELALEILQTVITEQGIEFDDHFAAHFVERINSLKDNNGLKTALNRRVMRAFMRDTVQAYAPELTHGTIEAPELTTIGIDVPVLAQPEPAHPAGRQWKAGEGEKAGQPLDIELIIASEVRKYNTLYSQVTTNGKSYICRESSDQLGRRSFEMFRVRDFREHCLNATSIPYDFDQYGNPKYKKSHEVWLEHPDKAFYSHGITFYPFPVKQHNGKLNRYFGLGVNAVEIRKGNEPNLKTYLTHIKKVICNNNPEHYEYVIKWLAHLVQKPHEKAEVGIVMQKAGQGTGKGAFMGPLGLIIGSHYIHPQNADHVVGKFNSLMECAILVFADEFFSGNKGVTDKLKGMITEKTTTIERKGIDAIEVPSFSRIIFASNHENSIRAESDERRYLFLTVSNEAQGDKEYFKNLFDAIGSFTSADEEEVKKRNTFAGKLLSYLLSVDIEGWHPRYIPHSDALTDAKMDNLDAMDSWLYSSLLRGTFAPMQTITDEDNGSLECRLGANKLQEHLLLWEKENQRKVYGDKPKKVGRILLKLGAKRLEQKTAYERYFYEFPPLEIMRQNFEAHLGFKIEW